MGGRSAKPRPRLFHGEALDILRGLPAESVDAVITDPPYSSGGRSTPERLSAPRTKYGVVGHPDFGGDNRDQRAYRYWSALWLSECLRVARPGAPVLVFTDWRQLPTTTDALQAGGWLWRGILPWDKTESVRPQLGRFRAQCEYVVWGSKGRMPLDREVGVLPGLARARVRRDDRFHLCGKPTALMRTLVQICRPGGIVLDPFMGSGTTGVAALGLGRGFVGIESDRHYYEVATGRVLRAA